MPPELAAAIDSELARHPPVPSESPDIWHLCLRAEGPGPTTEQRLRRFLKAALRGYGLRCCGYSTPIQCDSCRRRRAKS